MRRIAKGSTPTVLTTDAITDLNRMEVDLANGRKLKPDRNIYAHSTVKASLKVSHRKKCAYCERNLNGDFGDVEHFRPKGKYVDEQTGSLKLGYWWLAYDWDNLLLSCSECNRTYKQNHFPIVDENQRDIAGKDISREQPLLINPSTEDPSNYIEFNRWVVRPTMSNGIENIKGKKTIEILKLNERPDLVKKRRDRWEEVEAARNAGIDVNSWIGEDKEFTGMFQNQTNE